MTEQAREFLKNKIWESGLAYGQVATKCNVSRGTINNILYGKSTYVLPMTVAKMAPVLGFKLEEFYSL